MICSPPNQLYRVVFLFPMHATGVFFYRAELELEYFLLFIFASFSLSFLLFKLYSSSLLAVPLLGEKNLLPIESF